MVRVDTPRNFPLLNTVHLLFSRLHNIFCSSGVLSANPSLVLVYDATAPLTRHLTTTGSIYNLRKAPSTNIHTVKPHGRLFFSVGQHTDTYTAYILGCYFHPRVKAQELHPSLSARGPLPNRQADGVVAYVQ